MSCLDNNTLSQTLLAEKPGQLQSLLRDLHPKAVLLDCRYGLVVFLLISGSLLTLARMLVRTDYYFRVCRSRYDGVHSLYGKICSVIGDR